MLQVEHQLQCKFALQAPVRPPPSSENRVADFSSSVISGLSLEFGRSATLATRNPLFPFPYTPFFYPPSPDLYKEKRVTRVAEAEFVNDLIAFRCHHPPATLGRERGGWQRELGSTQTGRSTFIPSALADFEAGFFQHASSWGSERSACLALFSNLVFFGVGAPRAESEFRSKDPPAERQLRSIFAPDSRFSPAHRETAAGNRLNATADGGLLLHRALV